jgi:hypothetical protein
VKKFAQRSSQPLKNFSQTLDLPISAIYGGLVLIIVLAGVFIATASIRQEQSLSSEASQAEYGTVGCNQPCKNNRYCEADHFCYQGRCRLASNPQSPTCDPNEVFITPAPQPPTSIPTPTIQQKGDVIIKSPTATESTAGTIASSPTPTSTPSIVIPTTIPETESEPGAILGLLQQLPQIFENAELSLPMLVGIGLAGLILLLTLVAMINNRRKPKFKPTDFTNLREKSFSDNKKPKQENTAESLKSDQTPSPTQNELEDLKPPPSSMVSRLKEKGVKKPK